MRRLFVASLPSIALLVAGSAHAQNWRWLSPKPQGVGVNAITHVGSQEWLVGDFGTISTTTDGAKTFTSQSSGTNSNLNAVFFFDATHGWAVGDAGAIVATVDGGQHWTPQVSNASRQLHGVYFTSLLKGFAVGDFRTLLETTDGGKTWAGLGSVVLSLDAITFTDALHGYICGDTGSILVTTDGGATFNLVQTGTTSHLMAIAFADATHGIAVGLSGAVVTTADGGHSWTPQVVGADDLVSLTVISVTEAYALASDGALYATADGSTWNLVTTLSGTGLFRVIAVEQNGSFDAACATGQWFHAPNVPDAGLAPDFADVNDLFSTAGDVTSVAFGSVDAGVMVQVFGGLGGFGTLYGTQDRGRHIAPVDLPDGGAGVSWAAVSMPTPNDAYAVGSSGAFAASHDSGKTWTLSTIPGEFNLQAVQFLDSQRGIVAGFQGSVFITSNGGGVWQTSASTLVQDAFAVAFNDLQHGVVVGDFGEAGWTQNGQLFTDSFVSPGFNLFSAAYPAPGLIIVSGDFGTLAHSLDQGNTFLPLTPPTGWPINALWFFDHQNGILGGGAGSGMIFGTQDGAFSFDTQFSGATSVLGLSFVDRVNGYAVGGSGALLVTDTGGEQGCSTDADCVDAGSVGIQCLSGACQQCTQDSRCGATCSACPTTTPVCYGAYCGSCVNDLECTQDGGYCLLGTCHVPKTFDLDAGPVEDAGDGGSDLDAGEDGGEGTGTTTGTGGGTTGRAVTSSSGSSSTGGVATCANPPCKPSGCGCTQGGGVEAVLASALALAFCWPRRRRR